MDKNPTAQIQIQPRRMPRRQWCEEKTLDEEILHFLKELNHPEGYGYAVTQEVRDIAKRLYTRMNDRQRSKDDWK